LKNKSVGVARSTRAQVVRPKGRGRRDEASLDAVPGEHMVKCEAFRIYFSTSPNFFFEKERGWGIGHVLSNPESDSDDLC